MVNISYFLRPRIVFSLEAKVMKPFVAQFFKSNNYPEITDYYNVSSNFNYIDMYTNYHRVTYYFKFCSTTALMRHNSYLKNFTTEVWKSVACKTLLRIATGDVRIE